MAMKTVMFSTQSYDQESFSSTATSSSHEIKFLNVPLSPDTAPLAGGFPAVCIFVHDEASRPVLEQLKQAGVRFIVLRCAGFNNVDLVAAGDLGMKVARVPAYSPNAIAEHALTLILSLNRKVYRAYTRVREGNFSLDGLQGFDIHGKTAGIIGTGRIGAVLARSLAAIGCSVLAYDQNENPQCVSTGVRYVSLDELLSQSDIISLHCPLLPSTRHMIDERAVSLMKKGVMIINTSRGALIDTRAVIDGLKSEKIGYLGLDVYEEEEELFFRDLSNTVIQDDLFARLLTFPNVIITSHQAFLTREALAQIAQTTLGNLSAFEQGKPCPNEIIAQPS